MIRINNYIQEKLHLTKEYKNQSLIDEIMETILVGEFWLDNEIEETKETVKEWIDMTKVKEVEYYMYSSDKRYIKDPITVGNKIPVNILNRIEENDSICRKIRKDAKLFHLVKSSGDVTVINILLSDNALIVTYQINGRSISFYIINKDRKNQITEKLHISKNFKTSFDYKDILDVLDYDENQTTIAEEVKKWVEENNVEAVEYISDFNLNKETVIPEKYHKIVKFDKKYAMELSNKSDFNYIKKINMHDDIIVGNDLLIYCYQDVYNNYPATVSGKLYINKLK